MKNLFTGLLLFSCFSCLGQLKLKQHYTELSLEEWFEIQGIRHGQYIKSRFYFSPGDILLFGNFKKDQRSGEWYAFYTNAFNSINSRGEFKNDKRSERWIEYYPLIDTTFSLSKVLGTVQRAVLLAGISENDERMLAYDTTGQSLMAIGNYELGKKVGVWQYYSMKGAVVHVFDHTTRKLISRGSTSSSRAALEFLGGDERFRLKFFQLYQQYVSRRYGQGSDFSFMISAEDGAIHIKPISGHGSDFFQSLVMNVLQEMADDWIVSGALASQRLLKVTCPAYPLDYQMSFELK